MAKYDMKKRNTGYPRRTGFIRQVGLMCLFFVSGYVSASLYDYTKLSAWMSAHVLAPSLAPLSGKPVVQEAKIPKPKFEFYTLLTQDSRAGMPVDSAPNVNTVDHVPALPQPTIASSSSQPMDLTVTSSVADPHALPVPLSTSASVVAAHVTPSPSRHVNNDAYVVQLASFTRRSDAERMKAALTMKGFIVTITQVTQQRTHWFRVVLGPFASRTDAQRMHDMVVHRERIRGMIRKMDA